MTAEGNRVFENLWFFTDGCLLEAKTFVSTDNIDIAPIKNGLSHIQVIKQDYDFKEAEEKSRLFVKCRIESVAQTDMKASGRNCDKLRDLTLKYLLGNLG
jgi:hypothetical protein